MKKNNKLLSDIVLKWFPWTAVIFRMFPWLMQFINFSMVGIINLFLSYLIYVSCLYIGLHHQIANQIAFWLTVLNGYILNKFWVFQKGKSGKAKVEAIKYFFLYGINFVMGIFLLYLYVDILHWNKYLAPIISIPITVPMNYLLNRKWVFPERYPKKSEG